MSKKGGVSLSDFRQEPIELICRPVLKDVICRFGEKCFHNIHYLCEADVNGRECIPADACPFNAIVNNLRINRVERAGSCVRVEGRYDLVVLFTFDDQRRVGTARREDVEFVVQVPLQPIDGGCQDIVCENDTFQREVCAFNTRLEIVEATVEPDGSETGNICPGCDFRIRVVVEKIFRAFEHGTQVLCIPVCPPEACVPVPTTEAPFCPPFTRPTACPSFCVDDEVFSPNNCNQCPPPQVTVPPTTISPTPPVTTLPPTTQPPTTQPPRCDCSALSGPLTGTLPDLAFPPDARGNAYTLSFDICRGCEVNASVIFTTTINGLSQTLTGNVLTSLECDVDDSILEATGTGTFGPAGNLSPVTFEFRADLLQSDFTLVIREANVVVFNTGTDTAYTGAADFFDCP